MLYNSRIFKSFFKRVFLFKGFCRTCFSVTFFYKYIGHSLDILNIKNRFNLVLVAVKIPPKEGVITSIFRRNYKVDLSYGLNIPLGEKDILVLAGKFNDIKRFSES